MSKTKATVMKRPIKKYRVVKDENVAKALQEIQEQRDELARKCIAHEQIIKCQHAMLGHMFSRVAEDHLPAAIANLNEISQKMLGRDTFKLGEKQPESLIIKPGDPGFGVPSIGA